MTKTTSAGVRTFSALAGKENAARRCDTIRYKTRAKRYDTICLSKVSIPDDNDISRYLSTAIRCDTIMQGGERYQTISRHGDMVRYDMAAGPADTRR